VAPGDYEQYSLPPTTPLPAGVTALTDWTQHAAHGGWYGAQQMDDCRYKADPGGFQTWHGKLSARLEVNPADDPLQLGENSERTECLDEQDASGSSIDEGAASGTQYYATSYYFSTAWAATFYPYSVFEAGGSSWPGDVSADCGSAGNLCNSWSLILQFHGPGGGTPWVALAAGSPAPGQPQKLWLTGSEDVQLSDGGQIVTGAWVDLVIEVDWASGALTLWRRNQGQTSFAQVVASTFPAAMTGTYMKQGLYRGANVNGRTDVLWVGPTARGGSFVAVEQAAFGTSVGP
jgi:Polysaccharide lyase